jgi:hypothetical protein
MPGDAVYCREKAARCSQLAHEQSDPEMKRTFEELAESWMRLARQLEGLPPDFAGHQPVPSKP